MGLGNPGPQYRSTRHNAGFWFVDRWAEHLGLSWRKSWFHPCLMAVSTKETDSLVFVKPLTFMNRSGEVVPYLLKKWGAVADDVVVVFDQMDLPPGRLRMKPHGSSGGHNGLKSVDAVLGHERYHRIAVGVGRPTPGETVLDHVLGVPDDHDAQAILGSIDRVIPEVNGLWFRGWEPMIDAVNRRNRNAS